MTTLTEIVKHKLIFYLLPRIVEDIVQSIRNRSINILIKAYKDAIVLS